VVNLLVLNYLHPAPTTSVKQASGIFSAKSLSKNTKAGFELKAKSATQLPAKQAEVNFTLLYLNTIT
jgi:hypothetical protein